MLRSLPPARCFLPIALMLVLAAPCWSRRADAQSAAPRPPAEQAPSGDTISPVEQAPSGDTVRLTDEEREAILAANTVASAAAARGEAAGDDRAGPVVHGEVGAMAGSDGARAVYGTAAIPLGDHAGAVVSFESAQFGHRR